MDASNKDQTLDKNKQFTKSRLRDCRSMTGISRAYWDIQVYGLLASKIVLFVYYIVNSSNCEMSKYLTAKWRKAQPTEKFFNTYV